MNLVEGFLIPFQYRVAHCDHVGEDVADLNLHGFVQGAVVLLCDVFDFTVGERAAVFVCVVRTLWVALDAFGDGSDPDERFVVGVIEDDLRGLADGGVFSFHSVAV